MGVLRYSEPHLRELLTRAISIRWPDENLLLLTGCQAEPIPPPDHEGGFHPPRANGTYWAEAAQEGVVVATRSRLIYQDRSTASVLLRAAAFALTVGAILSLFLGGGLRTFLSLGAVSVAAWTLVKVIEAVTMGRLSVAFEQIHFIDRLDQMFEGRLRTGSLYRLKIPDPSDFRMIVSIVESSGLGYAA